MEIYIAKFQYLYPNELFGEYTFQYGECFIFSVSSSYEECRAKAFQKLKEVEEYPLYWDYTINPNSIDIYDDIDCAIWSKMGNITISKWTI